MLRDSLRKITGMIWGDDFWGMPREKARISIITSDRKGLYARQVRIAKSLANNDYKVKILAWDKTGTYPKIENFEGCKIHNFRFKPPLLGKLELFIGYSIWWVYATLYLLKDDADVYHPENLYSLIPAIPAKFIRRKRIIYDLVDFVADSFNWPELLRKFFAWLENFCLKFAEGVIVVDIRKQQLNMSNVKRLAVVTNCPEDLRDKFETQKAQNGFIIYYGGLIAMTRGLKHICEAIRDIEGVKLVIAGAGRDEKELSAVYKSQSNVEFKGLLSNIQSLEWTNKADVIFVFYDPRVRINRLASPSKLFDAMMCGTPVLANSEALPVAEIINKEKCGLIVPYNDIEGIRNAIRWLKDNPKAGVEMGQNGIKAFEQRYNWEIMERRLLALYQELTGEVR